MKYFSAVLTLIMLPLMAASRGDAEVTQRVRLNGTEGQVTLPPDSQEQSVVFWGDSKGVSTLGLGVYVEAPAGAVVEIVSSGTRRGTLSEVRPRATYNLLLTKRGENDARRQLTIPGLRSLSTVARAVHSVAAQGFQYCSIISDAQVEMLAELLSAQYGGSWDRQRVCDHIGQGGLSPGGEEGLPIGDDPSDGTSDPGNGPSLAKPEDPNDDFYRNEHNGRIEASTVISKNACDRSMKRYVVALKVDLSKVDRSKFPNGIAVRVKMMERRYSGKTGASIKPVSDGKFAPQPLLLMSSVGRWGAKESVQMVQWRKGKPGRAVSLRVEDYVYYKGFVLSRIVAGKVLRGGQATFEATNGTQSYGVCFDLVRRRQRVNGYPS
jgi:hypothetical protein